MIYALPFVGWVIGVFVSISMAIPFWFVWNKLAPLYFYFLPKVYQSIPFWHCVGLFIIIPIIKGMLWPGSIIKVDNHHK